MYLIVTRSFPPELGGMQNLMWGLSRELSKNFMIKVFADHNEGHEKLGHFIPDVKKYGNFSASNGVVDLSI